MNILDIVLLVCLIPALIQGLRKGFIAQVVAIISLVLGGWLAYKFSAVVTEWLAQWLDITGQALNIIVPFGENTRGKRQDNIARLAQQAPGTRIRAVQICSCHRTSGHIVRFHKRQVQPRFPVIPRFVIHVFGSQINILLGFPVPEKSFRIKLPSHDKNNTDRDIH